MLAVAGAITLFVGSTSDVGVLVRSGAVVRGLVDGGEWWRIFSCVFVHVGGLHLIVNVLGMWFVGRVAEELFGTTRTLALFGVAGFAGAVASYLASTAGISAGASGALFGLLGAVFVELTWHRQHYRAAWKRGMWGGLGVVILAQVGYGFLYPVIDQWAHGAGLVAGLVFGAILSPHAPWVGAGRQLGRVIAVIALGFMLTSGARVARTSIEDSFTRMPRIRHALGGVVIAAPANWTNDGVLAEPDGLMIIAVNRAPVVNVPSQMALWIADGAPTIARRHGFDTVDPAPNRVVKLPAGWEGVELIGTFADAMNYRQSYRLVVCGKAFGDQLITVIFHAQEAIATSAPGYLTRILSSIKPL
jgi:membrane associated rhomboid family serine protease